MGEDEEEMWRVDMVAFWSRQVFCTLSLSLGLLMLSGDQLF